MNMSMAFSGGCNSGKTTLMEKIKATFGSRVHLVHEYIRSQITSIDTIRNSGPNYFKLQQQIIAEKIRQEDEAQATCKGKLILIDRSLADSLFYLTFYVNIKELTEQKKEEYAALIRTITDVSRARKRYDIVFLMQPIPITAHDVMRPSDLVVTQSIEHRLIETLNIGLFTGLSKLTKVDVLKEEELVLTMCEEALSEL